VKKETKLLLIISLVLTSCVVTHHKKELIDFRDNKIPTNSLKINGYYFAELEREYDEYLPYPINEYYKKTGIKKIKYLSVFFIYEDGFAVNVGGIYGLASYYCVEKESYENTYESAHRTVELILESQNSKDKRIKRICGFKPNEINNKGLVKINKDSIKIQFYLVEMQNPTKDFFNSYYLYEINGIVKSDSSFVIKKETEYRNNKTTLQNTLFKFREKVQKPNIENYFKKNKNRFK